MYSHAIKRKVSNEASSSLNVCFVQVERKAEHGNKSTKLSTLVEGPIVG